MRSIMLACLLAGLFCLTGCDGLNHYVAWTMGGSLSDDAPTGTPPPGPGTPVPVSGTISGLINSYDTLLGECSDTPVPNVAVFIPEPGTEDALRVIDPQPGTAPTHSLRAWGYSDANGSFSLRAVPYGTHELVLYWLGDDGASVTKTLMVAHASPVHNIAEADTCLALSTSGGGCRPDGGVKALAGTVRTPSGAPLPNALVYATTTQQGGGQTPAGPGGLLLPPAAAVAHTYTRIDPAGCFVLELTDPAPMYWLYVAYQDQVSNFGYSAGPIPVPPATAVFHPSETQPIIVQLSL